MLLYIPANPFEAMRSYSFLVDPAVLLQCFAILSVPFLPLGCTELACNPMLSCDSRALHYAPQRSFPATAMQCVAMVLFPLHYTPAAPMRTNPLMWMRLACNPADPIWSIARLSVTNRFGPFLRVPFGRVHSDPLRSHPANPYRCNLFASRTIQSCGFDRFLSDCFLYSPVQSCRC